MAPMHSFVPFARWNLKTIDIKKPIDYWEMLHVNALENYAIGSFGKTESEPTYIFREPGSR